MNERVAADKELRTVMEKHFGRELVVPSEHIQLLEKLAGNRARFTHDTETRTTHTQFSESEILEHLIGFANKLRSGRIYPILIRILREVTNEYGVTHLEAVDEEDRQWIVNSGGWTPTGRIYMMQSQTERVAIDPLLITRFW